MDTLEDLSKKIVELKQEAEMLKTLHRNGETATKFRKQIISSEVRCNN